MRNAIVIMAIYQQKDVFREILLDLVGINFRNCRTIINPGHRRAAADYVFDVGNVAFERSLSAMEPSPER